MASLVALIAAASVVGLVVYVVAVGIPAPIVRHYLDGVERQQAVRIAVDRVRWSPWHHISASGVHLASRGGEFEADFRSVDVQLQTDRGGALQRRWVRGAVQGGQVRFADASGGPPTSVQLSECGLVYSSDGQSRIELEGRLCGDWLCSAVVRFRNADDQPTASQAATWGERLIALSHRAGRTLRYLDESFNVVGRSRVELDIQGAGPGSTNLLIQGTLHATDVSRYDVPVDLAYAAFSYSNGTVRAENLALVRRDGQVTGGCSYDLTEHLLSVDVRSTAPPLAMAQFIGPGLMRVLAPYHLDGPVALDAKGIIGLNGNPARNLRLHIEGSYIGWQWFRAEHAVFDLALGERATVVQDLNARWCGGDVSGLLRFERATMADVAARRHLELQIVGADLASVAELFGNIENRKAYEGSMTGQLTLTGESGPEFLARATGSGRIDLEEGYILSLPLFGGLSKYLAMLIPGLGYANQGDLRSTFKIHDGRVETNDAQLLGKLITIQGKGSYAFSKDLNVRVQVLFLKEGLTAAVTRLLTSPLTKALEFELTGTLKTPRWRPVNTPDRLLRFFTDNLGKMVPGGGDRRASPVDSASASSTQ
ncbi:MAG: hypothetical protein HQ523_00430 [Lentisphaerae bacterium]|nr:hypothetical protein [Lentisphaerota bacterium]